MESIYLCRQHILNMKTKNSFMCGDVTFKIFEKWIVCSKKYYDTHKYYITSTILIWLKSI